MKAHEEEELRTVVAETWRWLSCGPVAFGGTCVYCREDGCRYRTRISRLRKYRQHWRRSHFVRG